MSKHETIEELTANISEHDLGRGKGFLSLTKGKEAEMKRLHYIKICNLGISKHINSKR